MQQHRLFFKNKYVSSGLCFFLICYPLSYHRKTHTHTHTHTPKTSDFFFHRPGWLLWALLRGGVCADGCIHAVVRAQLSFLLGLLLSPPRETAVLQMRGQRNQQQQHRQSVLFSTSLLHRLPSRTSAPSPHRPQRMHRRSSLMGTSPAASAALSPPTPTSLPAGC
jgi:hypothetical protein